MRYFFPLFFFSIAVFVTFAIFNNLSEIVGGVGQFANTLTSIISSR